MISEGVFGNAACGAVVSVRSRANKISLWLNRSDEAFVIEAGKKMKKLFEESYGGEKLGKKMKEIHFEKFQNSEGGISFSV